MEGVGTIFGVVALFVALATLWFVSDAVRRIERQNQEFLETHVRAVKSAVEACESKVKDLEKHVAESNRKISDFAQNDAKVGESVVACRAIAEKVRADLDALVKSLPRGFRNVGSNRRDG